MLNLPRRIKQLLFALVDVGAVGFSLLFAFIIRLGWPILPRYVEFLQVYFVPIILIKLTTFFLFGMYRRFWRYASMRELRALIQAVAVSSMSILFFSYFLKTMPIPRSVLVIDGLITLITVGGIRFSGRTLAELRLYGAVAPNARRVLIVGAGDAGEMLVREMLKNTKLGYLPIGFIDDDRQKKGMQVHGVKVIGGREQIPKIAQTTTVNEVIIAMPSIDRKIKDEIVKACHESDIDCRTLPGIYELIDGRVGVGQIRDVQIEDILGRDPVKVDLDEISAFISGRSVLVTGAGGSIGAELCRQVSYFKPAMLVILDIAENSLFQIERELAEKALCPLITLVADVKDESRMDEILQAYHPQLIFHAAAYKHVPMMEMNPRAALENNFIGTTVLAEAAVRHRVAKFVLISTDKAVRPASMMGFSKALAERAVLCLSSDQTEFCVVRFGNVLASNGSVVPIFQRQIAAGGPVTVTHPEMKRYLMTITESVQLVLQAGAFAAGGDVFMLDMGEQVSIVELAGKLIELSGFDRDQIEIKFIGVRPGEKLEEELAAPTESKDVTIHPKIIKLRDETGKTTDSAAALSEIERLIRDGKMRTAAARMRELVLFDEHDTEAPADLALP